MDEQQQYSTLIKQLEHYNLEFLIPLHFNGDDDDAEGYCHMYSDMDRLVFDPTQDEYYDHIFDVEAYAEPEEEEGVKNLDDFLRIFNADYMDYSDLLSMNIWDLFGISKKQFDLIDFTKIPSSEFAYFYNVFMEEKRDLPIEKRIKYSIAETLTDYRPICMMSVQGCTADERLAYCERIIDTHSFDEIDTLIRMLNDYWRFYDDALEMNRIREVAGEEVFKYSPMPKPSHIHDLHNKAFRDHRAMETERRAEDRAELDQMIKGTAKSLDYRKFLYQDEEYVVKPVTGQDDLDFEGEYLSHCVASYGSYMARAASYIYLVRRRSEPDTPYFTAEIIPPGSSKERFKLTQLYTFNDKTDKPESLKKFIFDWARTKGFSIKCKV